MPIAWLSCTRIENNHEPGRIETSAAKFWQLEGCGKPAEVVIPAEDAAAAPGLACEALTIAYQCGALKQPAAKTEIPAKATP